MNVCPPNRHEVKHRLSKQTQTWLGGEGGGGSVWVSEKSTAWESKQETSPGRRASGKQCVDSQIQTGNSLIPLAQFLSGSHIARNRDMEVLRCSRFSKESERAGSKRKPGLESPDKSLTMKLQSYTVRVLMTKTEMIWCKKILQLFYLLPCQLLM